MHTALLWHLSKSTTTRIGPPGNVTSVRAGKGSGGAEFRRYAGPAPAGGRSAAGAGRPRPRSGLSDHTARLRRPDTPGTARPGPVFEAAHAYGGVALAPHADLVLVQPHEPGDLPVGHALGGQQDDARPLGRPPGDPLARGPSFQFSLFLTGYSKRRHRTHGPPSEQSSCLQGPQPPLGELFELRSVESER